MVDDGEVPSQLLVEPAIAGSSAKDERRRSTRRSLAGYQNSKEAIKDGNGAFLWLVEEPATADGVPGVWQPLRRTDQGALEQGESTVVAVDGGRAEVRLDKRLWIDRYSSVPPQADKKVRRSLWCRWDKNVSRWEPYEESVNVEIEAAYCRLVDVAHATPLELDVSREVNESVELEEPYKGRLAKLQLRCVTERAGVFSDSSASCHWSLVAVETDIESSWFSYGGTDRAMQRGFGNPDPYHSANDIPLQFGEAEETVLSKDVDRIYVIVHGIGEKIWSEEGSGQAAQVPLLRQNLHQSRLCKLGCSPAEGGEKWVPPDKIDLLDLQKIPKEEILTARWYEVVHSNDQDHRLQGITLPSIPEMRKIANFAVSDVLYFSQASHREKILTAVVESIEAALQRFRQYHPTFSGDVVLIGHSLGGVILFETLRNSRLPTIPLALFMLGSPLGMFLHCGDTVPPPDYSLPNGTRLFNIFHPLDPIAYRMEPLLQPHLVDVPPEQIPTKGLFGERKIQTGIRQLWNSAFGANTKTWESAGGTWLNLNKGFRVDWSLQEELSLLGGASDMMNTMNALASHSCYVKSPDVAAFIHNQCVAFSASSESAVPPDT